MAKKRKPQRRPGIGVDAYGGGTIDPTENVKALQQASSQRQDDLRKLNNLRIEAELKVVKAKIKATKEAARVERRHASELRKAEAQRLDSIRQVDREDVNKTAAQALNAISTLATTTNTTAETLRTQVAATKQAADTSLANSMGEVNKRLSALELSLSEGKGRQIVSDPILAELLAETKAQRIAGAGSSGQSQGAKNLWIVIAGIISLVIGAASIAIAFAKM